MARTDVLIMAAGRGERFGDAEPKQFALLGGRPVIVWAIERFVASGAVDTITVVAAPGDEKKVERIIEEHELGAGHRIVAGGETRQQSVWLGLQSLPPGRGRVLVHDAARPCLSAQLLDRILAALGECDAVVPAMRVVDTLAREREGRIDAVLDRVRVSGVQTPQAFETDLLLRAHRRAQARGFVSSDDGTLVFAMGEVVRTIPGERTNIKITYDDDLPVAEAILATQRRR